jgi:hypothetical protein
MPTPGNNHYIIVNAFEGVLLTDEEILIVYWNSPRLQWVRDINDATKYGREIFTSCPFDFGAFATIDEYTPDGKRVAVYCPCIPPGATTGKELTFYEVDPLPLT